MAAHTLEQAKEGGWLLTHQESWEEQSCSGISSCYQQHMDFCFCVHVMVCPLEGCPAYKKQKVIEDLRAFQKLMCGAKALLCPVSHVLARE